MKLQSVFKNFPRLTLVAFNLLVILIIFLLFEFGLRAFGPSWLNFRMKALATGNHKDFGSDANWKVLKRDGEFYSFAPNSMFKMYAFEYENTVHINALGGRNSFPEEKTDTSNCIPFTGDSFVLGVGVEDNENVVALTKNNTGLNFLNLGVTGTGMHFQRKMISKRFQELGTPSIVIFGFFIGNDFSDILAEREKDHTKGEASHNNISAVAETTAPSSNTFSWKLNYYINQNIFLKKLYTLQYIKEKILVLRNSGKAKVMKPVFYVMNEENKAYQSIVKAALDKEVEALSKEPYKSVVLVFPDRKQVNEQLRNDMSEYYGIDPKKLRPELPNLMLAEVLKKHGIPFIDATECMLQHKDDGSLYYTQDNHLTPLGQRIYSSCISKKLKAIILQQLGKRA